VPFVCLSSFPPKRAISASNFSAILQSGGGGGGGAGGGGGGGAGALDDTTSFTLECGSILR
jgi:hypothetical protein